jgi:hypothetical protein
VAEFAIQWVDQDYPSDRAEGIPWEQHQRSDGIVYLNPLFF